MGTLVPIPIGTEFSLRIYHAMRTCELPGKVVYVHSGSGLGIFGLGGFIHKIDADERSVLDAWLYDLARKRLAIPVRSDALPLTSPTPAGGVFKQTQHPGRLVTISQP